MNSIVVKTNTSVYPIYFENSFENLSETFKMAGFTNRKVVIITDENVQGIYAEQIIRLLKKEFKDVFLFSFEAGEKSKNLDSIRQMYEFFLENRLDRKSLIVALGGGVVGDMAGFAAATYMRGIDFVQIPTTLLAQVDSSVGGKVGVDFNGTKNIVGAFYQPKFVYINIETLKTLPSREFSAGMAETIKYGMILDESFYSYIDVNKTEIKDLNSDYLRYLVRCACEFKADVVSKDEKESGLREILNFGHTIGHAVETLYEFKLIHGECVAIGMVAALFISFLRGNIQKEYIEAFEGLLTFFKLPIRINGIKSEDIYNQMFLDKKVSNNTINFVLLNKIGDFYRTKDVTKQEILKAIDYISKAESNLASTLAGRF